MGSLDNMEVEIKEDEIIIDGFEIKPYWKRLILVLCPWKNPRIILKRPKMFYRKRNGELRELNSLLGMKSSENIGDRK